MELEVIRTSSKRKLDKILRNYFLFIKNSIASYVILIINENVQLFKSQGKKIKVFSPESDSFFSINVPVSDDSWRRWIFFFLNQLVLHVFNTYTECF